MRVLTDNLHLERPAGFGQASPIAEGAVMLPGNERNVKILYQTATLDVLGAETQTGRVSADVAVNFVVLYLDGEGALRSIEAQSNQSVAIDVEEASARMGARVWGWAEEVRAEESGGRLNLRAELIVKTCVLEELEQSVVSDVEEAGPLARQEVAVETVTQAATGRQRLLVTESFPSDREDARVLFATACPILSGVQAGEHTVNLNGEIKSTIVCTSAQSPYFTMQKILPFNLSVDAEGARFGMEALATLGVQELVAEFKPGEEGETLAVECILQADVYAFRRSEASVLTDLYSIRGDGLEVKTQELDFLCGVTAYSQDQNFAQALSLPEGSAPLRNIYGVMARPVAVELVQEERQTVAEGLISVTLFYDGGEGLTSATQALAFHQAFPPVEVDCALELRVCTVQAAQITSESADIQLVLNLSGPHYELCSIAVVTEVEDTGESEAAPAGVTLYYPAQGETLWQVGKRFHMDPEDVSRLNADSDGPMLIYKRQTEW